MVEKYNNLGLKILIKAKNQLKTPHEPNIILIDIKYKFQKHFQHPAFHMQMPS